ncbi:MAG: terminase, partial [Candidatus Thorarchaeota archaeon]
GQFKVFKNLRDWYGEKNIYHRKDGKIVKKFDDLMSATRYAFQSQRFAVVPGRRRKQNRKPPKGLRF